MIKPLVEILEPLSEHLKKYTLEQRQTASELPKLSIDPKTLEMQNVDAFNNRMFGDLRHLLEMVINYLSAYVPRADILNNIKNYIVTNEAYSYVIDDRLPFIYDKNTYDTGRIILVLLQDIEILHKDDQLIPTFGVTLGTVLQKFIDMYELDVALIIKLGINTLEAALKFYEHVLVKEQRAYHVQTIQLVQGYKNKLESDSQTIQTRLSDVLNKDQCSESTDKFLDFLDEMEQNNLQWISDNGERLKKEMLYQEVITAFAQNKFYLQEYVDYYYNGKESNSVIYSNFLEIHDRGLETITQARNTVKFIKSEKVLALYVENYKQLVEENKPQILDKLPEDVKDLKRYQTTLENYSKQLDAFDLMLKNSLNADMQDKHRQELAEIRDNFHNQKFQVHSHLNAIAESNAKARQHKMEVMQKEVAALFQEIQTHSNEENRYKSDLDQDMEAFNEYQSTFESEIRKDIEANTEKLRLYNAQHLFLNQLLNLMQNSPDDALKERYLTKLVDYLDENHQVTKSFKQLLDSYKQNIFGSRFIQPQINQMQSTISERITELNQQISTSENTGKALTKLSYSPQNGLLLSFEERIQDLTNKYKDARKINAKICFQHNVKCLDLKRLQQEDILSKNLEKLNSEVSKLKGFSWAGCVSLEERLSYLERVEGLISSVNTRHEDNKKQLEQMAESLEALEKSGTEETRSETAILRSSIDELTKKHNDYRAIVSGSIQSVYKDNLDLDIEHIDLFKQHEKPFLNLIELKRMDVLEQAFRLYHEKLEKLDSVCSRSDEQWTSPCKAFNALKKSFDEPELVEKYRQLVVLKNQCDESFKMLGKQYKFFVDTGKTAFFNFACKRLDGYLKQRSERYWLKDYFDRAAAFTFSCMGYQADVDLRETYIAELKCLLNDYDFNGYSTDVEEKIQEGIKRFYPASQNSEHSLRYVLKNLKEDFQQLIVHDESEIGADKVPA